MSKQKKKKKSFLNFFIGFLIFLAVIGICVLIVWKGFTVKQVEIDGNEFYDSEVIEQVVLNDEYSWNSLYVFFKFRFFDKQAIPFIDTMEITLKDPHTIHVTVYEKGMLGYIYMPDEGMNIYFDKDGIAVESSTVVIEDIPKIVGVTCEDVVLYEQLPIEKADLRELLTLTQTLKRNNLEPDSIIYGQKNSPILVYGNIEVQIGSQTLLTQKVERIAKILPELDGMSGILHVENWTEETSSIVFEKEE